MSNRDFYRQQRRFHHRHCRKKSKGDRVIFGLIVALIGTLFLLKTLHLVYFSLTLCWPIGLIIIGLIIGLKSRFHNNAWWILGIIGAANLTPFAVMGVPSTQLLWPALVILAGIAIAVRPRRRHPWDQRKHPWDPNDTKTVDMDTVTNTENNLNVDVTFGGRKEIVTSKEWRGGSISTSFGGCEINLMQADSTEQPMILELKVSFGGIELIVPSHWEIQNEISPSFGSVEDERTFRTATASEEKKVLILRGYCSFGSIEIKSY